MSTPETRSPLVTPTDLSSKATKDISAAMNGLLADVFALYVKTKNFHWHLSGPHFRDYHLLFDVQAEQIFAMTDPIAERLRKVAGPPRGRVGGALKLGESRVLQRGSSGARDSGSRAAVSPSTGGSRKHHMPSCA